MANQHTPPARPLLGTVSAERPTCHLCSWVMDLILGEFVIKRPSAACGTSSHRRMLAEQDTVPKSLRAWLEAAA